LIRFIDGEPIKPAKIYGRLCRASGRGRSCSVPGHSRRTTIRSGIVMARLIVGHNIIGVATGAAVP